MVGGCVSGASGKLQASGERGYAVRRWRRLGEMLVLEVYVKCEMKELVLKRTGGWVRIGLWF